MAHRLGILTIKSGLLNRGPQNRGFAVATPWPRQNSTLWATGAAVGLVRPSPVHTGAAWGAGAGGAGLGGPSEAARLHWTRWRLSEGRAL